MNVLLKQLLQETNFEMVATKLVTWVAAGAMIFGGVVPYIPQYLEIRKSNSAEGFSTFVCLTLLIANILRIFFWFGHRFETPLLLQSIIMIITMLAMVHICTLVKHRSEIIVSKPRTFTDLFQNEPETCYFKDEAVKFASSQLDHDLLDFDRQYFWRWTTFESYLQFLLLVTLLVGGVTYLLLDNVMYVETLGFLAVLFEAMLGAPQFYKNYQNGSTKGMSVNMVLCWTMGDVFKTIYFLLRRSPRQFWLCGMLQVSLDMAILLQVVYYRPQKDALP